MKASVIFHSKTGNTEKMAQVIVGGMQRVNGVEAKAFSIHNIDEAWLKESACVIVGSPTYYASVSGEIKTFLESLGKYPLAGKLGGAFATANYVHGGAELAMQLILTHMMVYGMLAYSGGGSFGVPVIHIGPQAIGKKLEEYEETFAIYGERMAKKAFELFGNK